MRSSNWRHCSCELCRRQRARAQRLRNRTLRRIASGCILLICGTVLAIYYFGGGLL